MKPLRVLPLVVLLVACAGNDSGGESAQSGDAEATVKAYPARDDTRVALDQPAVAPADTRVYELIVERVKARAYADDFRLLRDEYVKTELYNPVDSVEREHTQQLFEALDDNDLKRCVQLAARILARNFTSLAAHRTVMLCHEQSGDDITRQFHAAMYQGLLQSVLRSGDGRTPATAYQVISADEIDAVLLAQDLEVVSQSLQQLGEREYSRIHVRNPQNWREFDLYFDVTAEKQWYLKRLQAR